MVDVTRFEFQTFEDMRHCFRGADVEVVPLAPGPFWGSTTVARIGDIVLSSGHFNGSIRSRGSIQTNGITFGVQLNGRSRVIQWGAEALPGDMFVMPNNVEQDGRARGENDFATLSVSIESLEQMGALAALSAPDDTWTHNRQYSCSPAQRSALVRSIRHFAAKVECADFASATLDPEAFGRALLMPFLAGIQLEEGNGRMRAPCNGIALVRQVEDWIDGQHVPSTDVLSICRALKVNLRTLQRAFQRTLDMGPSQYLALRRLAHARAQLLEAADPSQTVTRIATANGFDELGRFAGFYRRYYGETPRETLLRGR